MTNFGQVNIRLVLLSLALVLLVNSQEAVEQNNKKNVSLEDPSVDETVKSALENGSVSEVVVRKDLLLFPVNAPNLVIAHTQEIHAVPQTNGSNRTDGKPTGAEVAEVNEYSLSQLVSTNDTDYDNETKSESSAVATGTTLLRGPQNLSLLEPGKLLEIVSGFNMSHGLATETVALPDQVQNISIPKQSIAGLLSKSLQPIDAPLTSTPSAYATATDFYPSYPYELLKRSADSQEDNSTDDPALLPPYPYIVKKRSLHSDESHSDEDSSSQDNTTDEPAKPIDNGDDAQKTSIEQNNSSDSTVTDATSASGQIVKRSASQDQSPVDNGSFGSVEYQATSTSSTTTDSALLDNLKMLKRSADLDADGDSSSTTDNHYYDYKD